MYNLCCISSSLAEQGHKFQTMTYHRFSSLSRDEAIATVSARTLNNIRVTYKILQHCAEQGWGYRVSSNLFPLLTYDVAELSHLARLDIKRAAMSAGSPLVLLTWILIGAR